MSLKDSGPVVRIATLLGLTYGVAKFLEWIGMSERAFNLFGLPILGGILIVYMMIFDIGDSDNKD